MGHAGSNWRHPDDAVANFLATVIEVGGRTLSLVDPIVVVIVLSAEPPRQRVDGKRINLAVFRCGGREVSPTHNYLTFVRPSETSFCLTWSSVAGLLPALKSKAGFFRSGAVATKAAATRTEVRRQRTTGSLDSSIVSPSHASAMSGSEGAAEYFHL